MPGKPDLKAVPANSDPHEKRPSSRPSSHSELGHFCERLKTAIGNRSVRGFSRDLGMSDGAVRAYLSGDSEPTRPVLLAMAKVTGVRLEWLSDGTGPMRPGDGPQLIPAGDQVPVQIHSLAASAGHGAFCDSDHTETVMVPRILVDQTGIALKDLCLVRVSGTSMEPDIRAGDVLFVDRGEQGRQKTDGTFIIRLNDALMVKNIQILPDGTVEVSSNNKAFRPIVVAHKDPASDFDLLARVVSGVRRF